MLVYGTVGGLGGCWKEVGEVTQKGINTDVWARDSDKEGIDGERVGEVFKFNVSW
jgi:hypothetical protein